MAQNKFHSSYSIPQLTGPENFLNWKTRIRFTLEGQELQEEGDATYVAKLIQNQPEHQQQDQIKKWKLEDYLVRKLIYQSVSDNIFTNIHALNTAKEIWDYLNSIYQPQTSCHITEVKKQILQVKLGSKTIREYITHIKQLYEQLKQLGKEADDSDIVATITLGLSQKYQPIITALNCLNENVSVAKLEQVLLQEEHRLQALEPIQPQALLTQNHNRIRNQSNPKKKCKHCPKFSNHTTEDCRKYCRNCKNKTHWTKDCRIKNKKAGSAHITEEQTATILVCGNPSDEFTIDSGSTHHIVKDKHLLTNLTPQMTQITVGNGSQMVSTHQGTLNLGNIIIHNVLLVPKAIRNLISVHELTQDGFIVNLQQNGGTISKNNLNVKIQRSGKFHIIPNSQCLFTNTEKNLLHQRLGHLSESSLNAYLNGILDTEVYMYQPQGFASGTDILKLKKGLYGLRQSGKLWNDRLKDVLLKAGYIQSIIDPCLFTHTAKLLLVYVDDLLLIGTDPNLINKLQAEFTIKCLGSVNQFLGTAITRTSNTFEVKHSRFIENLLKTHQMELCKPVTTPIESITLNENSPKTDLNKYQKLVGSLVYLSTTTRPDITFAVTFLSRNMSNPSIEHWTTAKRILRYLRGTQNVGITLRKGSNTLQAYADADLGGDKTSARSTSGTLLLYGDSPIKWKSKLQSTVAQSTTEAEYYALTEATKDLEWGASLLENIKIQFKTPLTLYGDNQSAIKFANNSNFQSRMRHVNLRHHFLKERVQTGRLCLTYVKSDDNLADGLTKALQKQKLIQIRLKLQGE